MCLHRCLDREESLCLSPRKVRARSSPAPKAVELKKKAVTVPRQIAYLEDRIGSGRIDLEESIADASSFECLILFFECHPRKFHADGASSFMLWESSAEIVSRPFSNDFSEWEC
jgi:hypothetical protein